MIGDNLLRFNKEQKYICLDSETCNLNLLDLNNAPWEWAWNVCTLEKVLERHQYYINWPTINISNQAAMITGFNQEIVSQQGRAPEFVLNELEKYLYDPQYKVIIHNGLGFDIYMHNIHRRILGRKPDYSYLNRLLDTNAIARAVKQGINPMPGEDLLTFQFKQYNSPVKGVKTSIKALVKDYEIEYDKAKAHGASYDCELLYQIWKKIVWQIEI